jgi:phosphomannomutase/phosphoglucomutase
MHPLDIEIYEHDNVMKIPRHAFREYDIRGVAEHDLTDDVAHSIGRAFASTLRADAASGDPRPRVVVGRDGRLSSPRLFRALVRGLTESGVNVVSIGVGPTPLLYFAAHHLGTEGAIMITGSHNPGPDNGMKLMRGKSSFYGADLQALAERIEADDFIQASTVGEHEEVDLSTEYVNAVERASSLAHTNLRLVIDAGNGAAGPLGMKALRHLGLDPDPLFCDIDGAFPNHHPDPTMPENLASLRERVLSTGARLGVAWDGDGDRIGAIDENGDIVWGDKLMILFARGVLREHPGAAILGEVKCSETLYTDIAKHGGRPIVWKTGHSLIKAKMKEEGALLAGEMSGHVFFADRYWGFDDAIYATVRLIEILAQGDRSLSELLADVPTTFATPELRIECAEAAKFGVVRRVFAHFRRTHAVLDIDGARIDFGDNAWGLCRASNTQPVLVLRFEARTEARRDEIRAEVEAVVAAAVVAESHASLA